MHPLPGVVSEGPIQNGPPSGDTSTCTFGQVHGAHSARAGLLTPPGLYGTIGPWVTDEYV